MIEATGLRWILTIVFAATGFFCLYRCFRQGPVTSRFGDVLHAAMCVAMVAMAWPATMAFARLPQLALFGFAAVWFAVATARGAAHGSRWHPAFHAVMMAAMAWMVFAMPRAMVGSGAASTMDMPGMEGMAMALPSAGGGVPADVVVVALVLAIAFCWAGVAFLARAIDGVRAAAPPVRTAGWGADALMGLGTTVMLLAML
ncbi:DUF5134 domain-containing protein [Amycolatopsis sp. NPDC048633]|uniref:DUF5134 domain-containing protein n=1 Tax=Amycolatopsis sp. NPDC048633 TaxID=3157095 RepID=UPI00340E6755